MSSTSHTTTDQKEIQKWVEERNGRPSKVKGTESKDSALLRIDFKEKDDDDDRLEEISWEEFFEIFDKNDLAFLYQEKTADGKESRFFKFIRRE